MKSMAIVMYGKRSHALYRYEEIDGLDLDYKMDVSSNINKMRKFGTGQKWGKKHIISIVAILFHNPKPATDFQQAALDQLDPELVNEQIALQREKNGNLKIPVRGCRRAGKLLVRFKDDDPNFPNVQKEWIPFSLARSFWGQAKADEHIYNTAVTTFKRFDQANSREVRAESRSPSAEYEPGS